MVTNIINHILLVLDKSPSMYPYRNTLPTVADNFIARLAARSKENDQETRVTVVTFSDPNKIECLVYDKDVLRLPSVSSLYRIDGMSTALIDAVVQSITDLQQTPTKYGDHAFLVYILTDGQENNSRTFDKVHTISSKMASLPENWTVGLFVPDQHGVFEAKRYGFPADNVTVWNPSDKGIHEFGEVIAKTTDNYMTNRSLGIRGTKSLFQMNDLTVADIKSLTPLLQSAYSMPYVQVDDRADRFYLGHFGVPWRIGKVYYQLMKKETIQPGKSMAVLYNNRVYTDPTSAHLAGITIGSPNLRGKLGLPVDGTSASVDPKNDKYKDYVIFVQSTAPNRKLIAGTRALLLK